jgi:hypothetical protein
MCPRCGCHNRARLTPPWLELVCASDPATYPVAVTADTFKREMAEALKAFDHYIVCLGKTPEEFQASVVSLLNKAIRAYEGRGPHLRHGIALDKQVTVILSQTDGPHPLCGIYFNLHTPYQKSPSARAAKPASGLERRKTTRG